MPVTLETMCVDACRFRWEPWDGGSKPGRTDEPFRAGDFVYVPGDYNRIQDGNGTEYTRTYISRMSALPSYGLDTTWNPAPSARVITGCHDAANDRLYFGGQFTTIAGVSRERLACFDLNDPSDPTINARFNGFNGPNGAVYAVELDGDGNLWVGGDFGGVGGQTRKNLAKLNISTATVTTMTTPNITMSASYVVDLAYDAINDQMIVLLKNQATINGGTAAKVLAVDVATGTINWQKNPLGSTPSFQCAVDEIQCYVAMDGSDWTYAYRLTDGLQRWTYSSDGNNQGVNTLGGYVFVTHHGDWVAPTKDTPGGVGSPNLPSTGIYCLDQNGVLQSWRPELRFPSGDPFGASTLKGFDVGKDDVSGQLYLAGDFGGVHDDVTNTSLNSRRFALFEGEGTTPPPPANTFRLTLNVGGSGGGRVVSTPPGIDSRVSTTFDFDEGEAVTLLATSDVGTDPVDWNGSGTGTGDTRSITMSSDKSVQALFAETGGVAGYGGPGDGIPILLAGGDFLAGNGRPDGGRPGVAALLQPYFDQDDAVGFVTLGDHAYNDGLEADFDGFDTDFGAMDRKNARDFLMPTPGSHDYGTWGTGGSAATGMTFFDTYFEALGLDIDNPVTANQFYRVDDILDVAGNETAWRILRLNGVRAQTGFDQTQTGVRDGLIIPMAAGSPQYAFMQAAMQAAKDDGKFMVVVSAHPRWTSPSPGHHTNESRIGPAWTLADAILPGRVIFLSGHQHNYERFAPQTAAGVVDTDAGNVQFVVGTAGNPSYDVITPLTNSEALQWDDAGLLELTLRDNGYGYRFVLNDGSVFDEGSVAMSTGGGGTGGNSLQNDFDNGAVADGDNLTTGNSTGGGDALSDVFKQGSATVKYSTSGPLTGSKLIRLVASGTTTTPRRAWIEFAMTAGSAYPEVSIRPSERAWSIVLAGHAASGLRRWSVALTKEGKVQLRNRRNQVVATSEFPIPLNGWTRLAVKAVLGTTQAGNILELRIYNPDATSIKQTLTVTDTPLGAVPGFQDFYRAGLLNPSKLFRTMDLDGFRVQDSGYWGAVEPTVEGWTFDASGPAGYGGMNGLEPDPNVAGRWHAVTDVGGYRRCDDDEQWFMRMKGNSHDSQRKAAGISAVDMGSTTRLLLAGGFAPAGFSISNDGGDSWDLLNSADANFNSQSPTAVAGDSPPLPHIPRSTGHLTDFIGSIGQYFWGCFAQGVKRYAGTGSASVIAFAQNGASKRYIRDLRKDPLIDTKLWVSEYHDSEDRGGLYAVGSIASGTATETKVTPAGIDDVNEIAFSDDGLRVYLACGHDGIWRGSRASSAANFGSFVDIGGSRISKQSEWCTVTCYTDGTDDVVVVGCHDAVKVTADGASGTGIISASEVGTTATYVCSSPHDLQTGQSVVVSGMIPTAGTPLAGYNGTFNVTGTPTATTFTATRPGGLSPSTQGGNWVPGGLRFGHLYRALVAQTGSSPTWDFVSDPGSAGFPGGGDADVNVLSKLTGERFRKADESQSTMLGRQAANVVSVRFHPLSPDGAKHAMCLGGGGVAYFSDDNASTWQVVPDGMTIVSTISVFKDRANPAFGWQTIQDLDAEYCTDMNAAYPDWRITPNVQNYTTAYGGHRAPDGTCLLLEGDEPANNNNEGEVLRWSGAGAGPIWTAIGGNNKGSSGATDPGSPSINGLPSRRPLACTKVKLANGTGRWIVYLENGGVWWLNDGGSTWTQATGFPTFASGNYRQHDMFAPNAWWTGSNATADGIVFLCVRDSANGGLWVSDTYGATWAKKVSDNGSSIYGAAAYGQSSIVYLSGGSGVRRITNPATMTLNQAGRIDSVTGFGGGTGSVTFADDGTLYIFCASSASALPRLWQIANPSSTELTFDDKVDILDPVDGSAADDSGQAALQYVNNIVCQGELVLIACSGGGVVRGRPRVAA